VLKTQDGVVGIPDLVRFPLQAGLHHVLEPFVEHIVQEGIGKQRTDRLPLPGSCFAHEEFAVLDDSHRDPFSDQAEHAAVVYALLNHLDELFPNNGIEGPHDTLPTTKTFQSMSPSLVRFIRWKGKNWLSLGNAVSTISYI